MSVDPDMSREDAVQIGRMGHKSFKRIMDLKIPTLAAINGAAMGGGVEVGLYHDYRTISKSPGGCDHYALPECFLGLVPGWGGTQLVTKLAGPEVAIQLIITNPLNMNAMINSKKAFEMGLADRIIPPAEFVDDSIKLLENIITGEEKIERKKVDPRMSDELYNNTKLAIMGRVHSGAMAPYRALDLIKGAADWSLDEGFEQENQTLADMIKSRQFLSSVYSFDLTQRRAKKLPGRPPKEVKGYSINKIGIIGKGIQHQQNRHHRRRPHGLADGPALRTALPVPRDHEGHQAGVCGQGPCLCARAARQAGEEGQNERSRCQVDGRGAYHRHSHL